MPRHLALAGSTQFPRHMGPLGHIVGEGGGGGGGGGGGQSNVYMQGQFDSIDILLLELVMVRKNDISEEMCSYLVALLDSTKGDTKDCQDVMNLTTVIFKSFEPLRTCSSLVGNNCMVLSEIKNRCIATEFRVICL